MPPSESSRRDLQAGNGPGAARAQTMMGKKKKILLGTRFNVFWFLGSVFCHHFEILEVSGALNGTTGKLSARSTS